MRGVLIALLLAVSGAAHAQDLLAPLPIRDQFLLTHGFFFFEPDDPRALADGDMQLSMSEVSANTFAKSAWISYNLASGSGRAKAITELAGSRFRADGPLFFADGESHRFETTMRRGFGSHLELGLTVPVIQIGGGWSDFLVEGVHHAFGLGNAGRDTLQQNDETILIDTPSAHYFRNQSAGYGLGDIALTGKYELPALEDKNVGMAIAAAVKLPTGSAAALAGSGSADAGVEMLLSRDLGRTRIHASIGVVRLGGDRIAGTRAQMVTSSTIAASRMMTASTAIIAQMTMSESPLRDSGLAELARRSNQLSIGVQRQVSRTMTAYVALIENVLNYENSADAGLAFGVGRKF